MHAIIRTQKPKHINDRFTAKGAKLISPKYMYANAEKNKNTAAIKCFMVFLFLRFLIIQ